MKLGPDIEQLERLVAASQLANHPDLGYGIEEDQLWERRLMTGPPGRTVIEVDSFEES